MKYVTIDIARALYKNNVCQYVRMKLFLLGRAHITILTLHKPHCNVAVLLFSSFF